jgi:hypothetical protein
LVEVERDREIAGRCTVSDQMVRKTRRPTLPVLQPLRDGKLQRNGIICAMNAAAIDKTPAQPEPHMARRTYGRPHARAL